MTTHVHIQFSVLFLNLLLVFICATEVTAIKYVLLKLSHQLITNDAMFYYLFYEFTLVLLFFFFNITDQIIQMRNI